MIDAVLQGVLEWIPVSSEGFVSLFHTLTGTAGVNRALGLHLGTGLAALVYFRKELRRIVITRFYWTSVLLSFVVSAPVYLFLRALPGNVLMLLTGLALLVTGRIQEHKPRRSVKSNPFVLGAAQGLSVIPGISRSAFTLSALLLMGFSPSEAYVWSYGIGIPASIAVGLLFFPGLPSVLLSFLVSLPVLHFLFPRIKKLSFSRFCEISGLLITITSLIPLVL